VRAASFLVSCTVCERLHKPERPLDFDPICPACTGRYAMASLQMAGFHPLTDEKIDEEVTGDTPGNYALGYLDGGTFVVFYVGRSDSDLNGCLHDWVRAESRFTRYAPAAQAAYGSRRRHPLPSGTPALRPVGVVVNGRYTHFKFSYARSAEEAFEKQCRNYHDFGGSYGLDNERHPVAGEGVSWRCPVRAGHRSPR
jgi:hypothetical protein